MDKDGNIIAWNTQAAHIFGYSAEQALGQKLAELILPSVYRATHRQGIARFLKTNKSTTINARIEVLGMRADSSEFPIELSITKVEQQDGYFFNAYIRDISARKQMEEELRVNKALLKSIIDHTPSGIFAFDLHHRFTLLNDATAKFYGLPEQDVLGKTLHDIFPNELADRLMTINSQILATGEPLTYEEIVTSKFNNIPSYLITSKFPLRDANGKINGLGGVATDITERKLAENALRNSESRFRSVIDASPIPMALNDTHGNITYLNHAFIQTIGYTLDDIPTLADWWSRAYPDPHYQQWVIENWQNRLTEAIRSNQPFVPAEINITCKDGTVRTFIVAASALKDNFVGTHLVTLYDITERKIAEKKLAESESIMATVLENASAYIFLKDTEGRYTYVNKPCLELWDLPIEKVIGVTNEDLFDPQFAATIREIDLRVLVNGESIAQEETATALKTGKTAIYWAVKIPLRNADGSIYGLCGISTDITAQKEMNKEMHSSKAKLEAALASMNDAVFISDTEGQFIEFNEAFATFHKFKNKEDCPKTLAEFPTLIDVYSITSGEFLPLEQRTVPRALRGETGTGLEFTLQRRDTGETWVGSYSYAPIRDNSGVIVGSVVTARDITASKHTENALKNSEEHFRSLFTQAPLGIALINSLTGQIYKANPKYAEIVGLSIDELEGIDWMQITHPDDVQADLDNMALMNAGKTNGFIMEKRYIHVDGSIVWINLTVAKILLKEQGDPCHHCIVEDITARKKITEALNAREKEFRLLAESMPQIVWITRVDGECIYLNQQWVDYTGLSFEESYGHNWSNALHPDDQQHALNAWQTALHNNSDYSFECRLRRADGVYRWWLDRGVPVFDDTGKVYKWFGTCTDIHELKEFEKSLRIAAIAFESQEAMVITDDKQTILKVNQAFTRTTGYSAEEAIGKTPVLLKSGNQNKQFYDTMWESLNSDKFWAGELWNRRKNGELYPEWLSISAVTDANGQVSNYVAAFTDITESKKLEETIYHLAFYDPLTKLPNRRLLVEYLQQALNSSTRHLNHGALLFIDLDNFKELNDIRGYEVGDALLIDVAKRLQHSVRSNDKVSCLGGDDFVIVLEELSRETEQAAIQAESFAEKIHVILSQPFYLHGQQYYNACSIGISLFCNHDTSVDDLLKYANTAMYQAKKSGRNSIRFFDPVTHEALKKRIALEFDLRFALLNQQFRLYYQMQVDNTGKILGAEALIRWAHPERGLVLPMQFIHLTEENGLIVAIGLWVLETACAQIKRWELNHHTQHLQLAVNVSARQFRQADFVEQVCAVLAKTAINPNRLKLELTESLMLEDVSDTILKIQALKDMGVHFSMDDFGTGYSSLSHLSKLPMNQLKIDQSFVHNIGIKDSDAVIVQTIIGMAKNLGMEVIAEGVETEQQRDFLERNGCTHYQGYLFSKPLPLEEFEQLLLKRVR
jgi:diguanylate cyclase (GGDEF)-like protein/PAS domain S-box-containing protein